MKNDVKAGPIFDVRAFGRSKIGKHQVTALDRDAIEQKIIRVSRLSPVVQLGHEGMIRRRGKDSDVDVRRTPRVGHGLDGAEAVAAECIGMRVTETLKSRVYWRLAPLARMTVTPVGVTLPDLDAHVSDRPAIHIPDMSAEIGDLATGRSLLAAHAGEIVIVVEWQFNGIEGAGGLPRRWRQQISRKARATESQTSPQSQ
jgi:hypothetical protein